MAQVERAVEVNAPVSTIEQRWERFEALPCCALHGVTANVKWRAEVLTFEPIAAGTRIKLKIEYQPGGCEAALPARIDAALESFVAFLGAGRPAASARV